MCVSESKLVNNITNQPILRDVDMTKGIFVTDAEFNQPLDRTKLYNVESSPELGLDMLYFGGGIGSDVHIINIDNDHTVARGHITIVDGPFGA